MTGQSDHRSVTCQPTHTDRSGPGKSTLIASFGWSNVAVRNPRIMSSCCEILKQIADIFKDRIIRKECIPNRVLVTVKRPNSGEPRIEVSQREAKFFLDITGRLQYHVPKFLGDFFLRLIFHLRALEKSLNWRSCIVARVALLFESLDSNALLIEGKRA